MRKINLFDFVLIFLAFVSLAEASNTAAAQLDPSIGISRSNQELFLDYPKIKEVDGFFRIEDWNYLNVSISTPKNIAVSLQNIPPIIEYDINSANTPGFAKISIQNLMPFKNYYLYEDSYRNLKIFKTDTSGTFAYSQDLSKPYHVWIQPSPATIFILDDANGGDCKAKSVGEWSTKTKTCTLTTDLNQSVELQSSNITLDCNLHRIKGTDTGYGVYANSKDGATVKNCKINNFYKGIFIRYTSGISITDNNTSLNYLTGISLEHVSDSYINNNITSNNGRGSYGYGIYLYANSNRNAITNNKTSKNVQTAIAVIDSSNNNTVMGNDSNSEWTDAIKIVNASGNIVANNRIFFAGGRCIVLGRASENIITNNLCEGWGEIDIDFSTYNIVKGNNCHSSDVYNPSIQLEDSNHNIIVNNKISSIILGYLGSPTYGNIISNNEVTNSNYGGDNPGYSKSGVYITGRANSNMITNNTVTNNRNGIYRYFPYGGPDTNNVITYNDIYDNEGYNFNNTLKGDATAEKNWWGTADASEIAAKIYDYDDNPDYGKVDYTPWLTESKRVSLKIISPTEMSPFDANEIIQVLFEIKHNGNRIAIPQVEYKLKWSDPWTTVGLNGLGVYSFLAQAPSTTGNYALILKADINGAWIVNSTTYKVEPPTPLARDLYIEWIKPIQVVEGVPLVAGKATVVRVKVVNNGPETTTDVSVNYGGGCYTETKSKVLIRANSFEIVDFYPPNNCMHT